MTPPRPLCRLGCGRPAEKERTLCARCRQQLKRHGLAGEELRRKQAAGATCQLCERRRKYVDQSLGVPLCRGCYQAVLSGLRVSGWLDRLQAMVDRMIREGI